jgi:hypothetical protein
LSRPDGENVLGVYFHRHGRKLHVFFEGLLFPLFCSLVLGNLLEDQVCQINRLTTFCCIWWILAQVEGRVGGYGWVEAVECV